MKTLEELLMETCRVFSVEIEHVKGRDSSHEVVIARVAFCNAAKLYGYTGNSISAIINRPPNSVFYITNSKKQRTPLYERGYRDLKQRLGLLKNA